MKNFLQDLVAHTHALGFLPLVRITASDEETIIDSMADDKTVVMTAKTHTPVTGVEGVFGMPNLNKLHLHLKCPEYKENASITVVNEERNGVTIPTGLHFVNATGDFQNDYRFMNAEIINKKLNSVKFTGAKWVIEFEPLLSSIQRLKLQAEANSEEPVVQVATKDKNLVFSFGDVNTHAGRFVFHPDIKGTLKQTWSWPVSQIQSILNLNGKITMKLADSGIMQISIDSGIADYTYYLLAQVK